MKKFSLTKIVSFALVCAMLMGAFMFTTFAENETDASTVEIVANNVYFGDTLHIMYAIKAPEGATMTAVDSNDNKIEVIPFTDKDGNTTVNIDGVDYPMYALEVGVAAQAIDEQITVTVQADNGDKDEKTYSVLEFIYERMYVDNVEGTERAMYEALLAYADAADIAINGASAEESLGNLVYFNATDCNLNGETTGFITKGETVEFTTGTTAEAGYVVKFVITNLVKNTETKISAEKMLEEGYTVTDPFSVKVVVEESTEGVPVTESMDIFANKGTTGTDTIYWSNGNFTVTNNKSKSTTAIRTSDADHFRIYAKSELIITGTGITKIVFTSTSSSYATALAGSLTTEGVTATASGSTVTVTVDNGGTVDMISFTLTAQSRINKVEVTYISQ